MPDADPRDPTGAPAGPGLVLVTGATGHVGGPLLRRLAEAGTPVRAAVRRPERVPVPGVERVALDLTDPGTYDAALVGVRALFLVRPPQVGNPAVLVAFLERAVATGVRHVVLLSVQGAERLPFLPHARVEAWLERSGLGWTFLRASFFDQNLVDVHGAVIRDRSEVVVPAGRGRTAFVDAEDVAEAAAVALRRPDEHRGQAWTLTGSEALTYGEVAGILTAVLDRPVRYTQPGLLAYLLTAHRRLRMPPALVVTTALIYTTARLGLAAGLTGDLERVLGRPPTTFATFARREQVVWRSGA